MLTFVAVILMQHINSQIMAKDAFEIGLNTKENISLNKEFQDKLIKSHQQRMNKLDGIECLTYDNCVHNIKRDFLEGYRLKEELLLTNEDEWKFVEREGNQPDDSDFKRKYQFLIEYCNDNPTVGIYCGCRVQISLNEDLSTAIQEIQKEWDCSKAKKGAFNMKNNFIKNLMLNKKIPSYYQNLEQTDNANEHTFWPFWIRIKDGEDLTLFAVEVLNIIKDLYNVRFISKSHKSQIKPFSVEALKKLLADDSRINEFIASLERYPFIFEKNDNYECAWKYKGGTIFCRFIAESPNFSVCRELINKRNEEHWPWKDLCRVFQKKDGSQMSAKSLAVEYSKYNKLQQKAVP